MDIGERLLKPWEFWSDSFSGGVRTSLLIGEASWQETCFGKMITASVFAPEGRSLGNWRQDSVSLSGDTKVMDHARLLWSVSSTKDYDLGDLLSSFTTSTAVTSALTTILWSYHLLDTSVVKYVAWSCSAAAGVVGRGLAKFWALWGPNGFLALSK